MAPIKDLKSKSGARKGKLKLSGGVRCDCGAVLSSKFKYSRHFNYNCELGPKIRERCTHCDQEINPDHKARHLKSCQSKVDRKITELDKQLQEMLNTIGDPGGEKEFREGYCFAYDSKLHIARYIFEEIDPRCLATAWPKNEVRWIVDKSHSKSERLTRDEIYEINPSVKLAPNNSLHRPKKNEFQFVQLVCEAYHNFDSKRKASTQICSIGCFQYSYMCIRYGAWKQLEISFKYLRARYHRVFVLTSTHVGQNPSTCGTDKKVVAIADGFLKIAIVLTTTNTWYYDAFYIPNNESSNKPPNSYRLVGFSSLDEKCSEYRFLLNIRGVVKQRELFEEGSKEEEKWLDKHPVQSRDEDPTQELSSQLGTSFMEVEDMTQELTSQLSTSPQQRGIMEGVPPPNSNESKSSCIVKIPLVKLKRPPTEFTTPAFPPNEEPTQELPSQLGTSFMEVEDMTQELPSQFSTSRQQSGLMDGDDTTQDFNNFGNDEDVIVIKVKDRRNRKFKKKKCAFRGVLKSKTENKKRRRKNKINKIRRNKNVLGTVISGGVQCICGRVLPFQKYLNKHFRYFCPKGPKIKVRCKYCKEDICRPKMRMHLQKAHENELWYDWNEDTEQRELTELDKQLQEMLNTIGDPGGKKEFREGYCFVYDSKLRIARYTFEEVDQRCLSRQPKRTTSWFTDKELPAKARLSSKDLESIKSMTWHFGHLVPVQYHHFDEQRYEAIKLSSIGCIQHGAVNAMAWKSLETSFKYLSARYHRVFVLSATRMSKTPKFRGERKKVARANGFIKIAIVMTSSTQWMYDAYYIPNKRTSTQSPNSYRLTDFRALDKKCRDFRFLNNIRGVVEQRDLFNEGIQAKHEWLVGHPQQDSDEDLTQELSAQLSPSAPQGLLDKDELTQDFNNEEIERENLELVIEGLKKENGGLKKENEGLKKENEELKRQLTAIPHCTTSTLE